MEFSEAPVKREFPILSNSPFGLRAAQTGIVGGGND
jgi:hypothetical protein